MSLCLSLPVYFLDLVFFSGYHSETNSLAHLWLVVIFLKLFQVLRTFPRATSLLLEQIGGDVGKQGPDSFCGILDANLRTSNLGVLGHSKGRGGLNRCGRNLGWKARRGRRRGGGEGRAVRAQ
jgi:hypothetical protein